MSDKARSTFPVSVSVSAGDRPTHTVLNAIASQAKNGLSIIERLVGDPWNQAGDPVLSPGSDPTDNALHIPNLARAIGDLALLNPRINIPTSVNSYTDPIGLRAAGYTEVYLRYPLTASPPFTGAEFVWSGTSVPTAFVSDPRDMSVSSEWTIDSSGKIQTFAKISSDWEVEYEPAIPEEITGGTFNFIPDPSVTSGNFRGLKIVDDGAGGYNLYLPPRRPLGASRTVNESPNTGSDNIDLTPDLAGDLLAYQDTSITDGSTQAHYRYIFPILISSQLAGTVLPQGFLHLWDEEEGTIVEGVTFRAPSGGLPGQWVVQCSGSLLDDLFNGDTDYRSLAADHSASAYHARFKIIIVGVSLAESLSSLWGQFLDHAHDNSDFGTLIDHSKLNNLITPPYDTATNPDYPTGRATITPSIWTNDDHSQYLHRIGSTGADGTKRDTYDNAMLGDLVVGASANVGGWLNTATDSWSLYFGDNDGGPSFFFDASEGTLNFVKATVSQGNFCLQDNKLQFDVGDDRSGIVKYGIYFKFGAGESGSPKTGDTGLVANSLILNTSIAGIFSSPSENPLDSTNRLVLKANSDSAHTIIANGQNLSIYTNTVGKSISITAGSGGLNLISSNGETSIVGNPISITAGGGNGDLSISGRVASYPWYDSGETESGSLTARQINRLTSGEYAADAQVAGTEQYHRHSIYANNGPGNKIGVASGTFTFNCPTTDGTTTFTVDLTDGSVSGAASAAATGSSYQGTFTAAVAAIASIGNTVLNGNLVDHGGIEYDVYVSATTATSITIRLVVSNAGVTPKHKVERINWMATGVVSDTQL